MINYEDCKKIALSLNSKVNACKEFEKAYQFFEETDEEIDGDAGVIVLKSNGKAINFVTFILNYEPEKQGKKIPF